MKIKSLYYITHKDNLSSILERGIFSSDRVEAESLRPTPIYDGRGVEQRNTKTTDGINLWVYANLYFQPRNAMMYRTVHQKDLKNLAVVGVNKKVLDEEDVVITDGNAANETTQFYCLSEGLKILKRHGSIIQNDRWNNSDGSKRKMMAECLIPNYIKPAYIHSVYVADNTLQSEIKKIVNNPKIAVNSEPDMFFQPRNQIKVGQNISLIDGGDIFFSELQTLTVTVNLQGVMGKGLALRTREQFPDVYVEYEKACRSKKITTERPYIYKREESVADELSDFKPHRVNIKNPMKWFLLFATKRHWRQNSRIEDIESGLKWLQNNYKEEGIQSLAMSALGCALGGLNWADVAPLMCKYLDEIGIPVEIYLPREYSIEPQHLVESHLLTR
jgi:O-acetyl-ADP-ribose deacetylase (regulator of RNase III)